MSQIGDLKARITADTKGFDQGMQSARRASQNFSQRASDNMKKLALAVKAAQAAVGALAAAFASRAMLKAIETAVNNLDDIAKTSQRVGISTTGLQEWTYAAERMGVSSDVMHRSIERLNRTMGNAAAGQETYIRLYRQLGVEIRDAEGNIRPTEDVLRDVIAQLGKIPDMATRTAIGMQLLGRGAGEMATMIEQGVGAIDDLRERAHRLGIVFDEDMIAKATAARDTLQDLRKVMAARFTMIVADNLDVITQVLNDLILLVNKTAELMRTMKRNDLGFWTREELLARREENEKKIQAARDAGAIENRFYVSETIAAPQRDNVRIDRELEREDRVDPYRFDPTSFKRDPAGGEAPGGFNVNEDRDKKAADRAAEQEARRLENLQRKYEDLADPTAKYRRELEELDEVYSKSGMSTEDYVAAHAKIHEQLSSATEVLEDYNDALIDWAEAMLESLNPYADVERAERYLEEARAAGILTTEQMLELEEELAKRRKEVADSLKKETNTMGKLVEQSGMAFASAFEQAIIDGNKMRDIIQGLTQDLLRLALRAMVTQPLVDAIGGFAGSFGAGAGGKAGGGQLQANSLTWVGERGPELIASNSPARVLNNHQSRHMMAQGKQDVKVEIVNRGTPVEAVSSQSTMTPQGIVVSIVTEDIRKGGPISQGLGNLYGLQRKR